MLRIKSTFLHLMSEFSPLCSEASTPTPNQEIHPQPEPPSYRAADFKAIQFSFPARSGTGERQAKPRRQTLFSPSTSKAEKGRGRLWSKGVCFFSTSVDLVTFWMFGKSFVNLRLSIPFHTKFEAGRLQADSCRFGASLCILHIVVDRGAFLSSSGTMPQVTLQSLVLV